MEKGFTYRLVADLIQTLEAEGYQMGTGQYLRVQQLLRQLPDGLDTEQLMYALAPLFVRTPQQQDQFYRLFRQSTVRTSRYFDTLRAPASAPAGQKHRKPRRLRWLIGLLLFLLIVPPLIVLGLRYWEESHQAVEVTFAVNAGSSQEACIPTEVQAARLGGIDTYEVLHSGEAELGSFLLNGNCISYTAKDSILGQDSIVVRYENSWNTLVVNFRPVIEASNLPPTPEPNAPRKPDPEPAYEPGASEPAWANLSPPYPHNLFAFATESPTWLQQQLARYENLLRTGGYILAYAFLIALLIYRLRRRQGRVVSKGSDKPPYVWHIRIPEVEHLEFGPAFQRLLNRLRQRTQGEVYQLDVPATIQSTIQKAGMADFQYRQQTRPPEYLLLIDQQSVRNHRARLFDYIFRAFRANEVLAERFFFDGDPRVCYNAQYPEGIALSDLQQQYGQARLFIIGQGQSLLNKMTGRLSRWTSLLEGWKGRALFTPKPHDKWGRKERRLGQLFTVLPLELESLEILLEALENDEIPTTATWLSRLSGRLRPPIQLDGPLMSSLEAHYSKPMRQWIAACALFPSLHWHLTLYFGRFLSTPQQPLMTYEAVQELCRLPWFTNGTIPDNARYQLIEWLEADAPALAKQLRTALNEVLRNNAPPEDSAAYENFQLHAAINEYLALGRSARRDQLGEEIAALMEAGNSLDEVATAQLQGQQSSWADRLPSQWKDRLFWQGLPALGLKHFWREMRWFGPALLFVAALANIPWNFRLSDCEGALVSLQVQKSTDFICLDQRAAWQLYLETYAKEHILAAEQPADALPVVSRALGASRGLSIFQIKREDDIGRGLTWNWYLPERGESLAGDWGRLATFEDSLLLSIRPATGRDTLDSEIRANLAVALYNKGAAMMQESQGSADSLSYREQACTYFAAAIAIDSTNLNTVQLRSSCEGQPALNPSCVTLTQETVLRSQPISESKWRAVNEQLESGQADSELDANWALFRVFEGDRVQLLQAQENGYWAVVNGVPGYLFRAAGKEEELLTPCAKQFEYVRGRVIGGAAPSRGLSGATVSTASYSTTTNGEGQYALEIPRSLLSASQTLKLTFQHPYYETRTLEFPTASPPDVTLEPLSKMTSDGSYPLELYVENLSSGAPVQDAEVVQLSTQELLGLTNASGILKQLLPRQKKDGLNLQIRKAGFEPAESFVSSRALAAGQRQNVALRPLGKTAQPELPTKAEGGGAAVATPSKGGYTWILYNGGGGASPVFDDRRTQLDGYAINEALIKQIARSLDREGIRYDVIDQRSSNAKELGRQIAEMPGQKIMLNFSFRTSENTQQWEDGAEGISAVAPIESSRLSERTAAILMESAMRNTPLKNAGLQQNEGTNPFNFRPMLYSQAVLYNGNLSSRPDASLLVQPAVQRDLANAYLKAIYEIETKGLAGTAAPLMYEERDADGDGVNNGTDRCPFEPGMGTANGCPLPPGTLRDVATLANRAPEVWKERQNTEQSYATTGTAFVEMGVRGRYAVLQPLINPAVLESIFGEPVFLKGPHSGAAINYDSEDSFGHYNPEFLKKLNASLTALAKMDGVVEQLQPLYDREFKQVMRGFFETYESATNRPRLTEMFMEILDRPSGKGGKGREINRFFIDQFTDMPGGMEGLEHMMASRFWVRRSVDGTEDEFFQLMLLALQTFDPEYLYSKSN